MIFNSAGIISKHLIFLHDDILIRDRPINNSYLMKHQEGSKWLKNYFNYLIEKKIQDEDEQKIVSYIFMPPGLIQFQIAADS